MKKNQAAKKWQLLSAGLHHSIVERRVEFGYYNDIISSVEFYMRIFLKYVYGETGGLPANANVTIFFWYVMLIGMCHIYSEKFSANTTKRAIYNQSPNTFIIRWMIFLKKKWMFTLQ